MRKVKPMPSKEELHALFEYKNGKLFWKVSRGAAKAGDEVKGINNKGYKRVCIDYVGYLQHRLIWIMHGNDPVDCLDHIDGDTLNNRIENLRPATEEENHWNVKIRSDNTSGIKGVAWHKKYMCWYGRVGFKGKLHFAGYFTDKEECAKAVRELRAKLHGDFVNHG